MFKRALGLMLIAPVATFFVAKQGLTKLSVYGYQIIDMLAQAAQKAGSNLSSDSLIKTMDSMKFPADIFGAPEINFTATKRIGSSASRISQIQDGRWKVVADYAIPCHPALILLRCTSCFR